MKKIVQSYSGLLVALIATVLLLQACDKMNDVQSAFANVDEKIYLGKVDSVKSYPGLQKVKLVWQINADPKIENTIIYWNNRKDSIVKTFSRTSSGIQKDSVTISNLPVGAILFEFINTNHSGDRSLITKYTATIWSNSFSSTLRGRVINSFEYNNALSQYRLVAAPTMVGDSILYTEILYTDKNNQSLSYKMSRSDTAIVLPNFSSGGTFQYRTVFFPPQGVDTIFSNYTTYTAPFAKTDRGVKIALKGVATSKYFDYKGDLAEWNAAGDLITYTVNADGSLTQKLKYTAIAPRTTFRDFFYYYEDIFIGVKTNNNLSLYKIVNNVLTVQMASGNLDYLGSGFSFPKFASSNGFFFSIDAVGEIKSWVALPNVTWGSPNGVSVQKGFTHDPYVLYNFSNLLGVDASGNLWSSNVSSSGLIDAKNIIGSGWKRFVKLFSVGSKLYGMESNGDLYVFNNFVATGTYWIVN